MGPLSPAKIIHKGFALYGNACILIKSVHRLPRENTNSAGKCHLFLYVHTMAKLLFKISKNNKIMLQFIICEILMR